MGENLGEESAHTHLESASGLEGGWVVDHLEDERTAGAHLDLADVEAEAK